MAKHKRLAVIGLGEFGSLLVRHLYDAGHEVLAIDRDMERVENIVPDCTQSVCLDSTDANALKAQELEDMDAVIVALTDFESLITTQKPHTLRPCHAALMKGSRAHSF